MAMIQRISIGIAIFCAVAALDGCKTVFLSSTTYTGDLGGVIGADAKCQSLANAAGLSGSYKAWISDSKQSPSTRFSQDQLSRYRRTDGITIANNWAALASGTLNAPIVCDEAGRCGLSGFTWSGTESNGTGSTPNCLDWTSAASAAPGIAGDSGKTNSYWSDATFEFESVAICSQSLHLYCVGQ